MLGLAFLGYNGVWALALVPLFLGMRGFDARFMKIHLIFEFISITVSILASLATGAALFLVDAGEVRPSQSNESGSPSKSIRCQVWRELILMANFAATILIHLWGSFTGGKMGLGRGWG